MRSRRPRRWILLLTAGLLAACGDSSEVATSSTAAPAPAPAATTPSTAPSTTSPTTSATVSTTSPTSAAVTTSTAAEPTGSTAAPSTTEPAPRVLATATFQGLAGHRGRGTASLVADPDGSRVIDTRDTDIGSGPALIVYLVRGADRRDLDGAVLIADLAAETGDHRYRIPDDVELAAGDWTVLVWCETFTVEVANATWTL